MNRKPVWVVMWLLLVVILTLAQPQRLPADELAQGKKVYVNQCALCHGIEGTGGKGPALNVPKLQRATNDTELAQVIRRGLPGSEMPGFWALSDREIQQLVSYVQSLGRTEQVNLPGDIARGQKLYETHCAACHIVRGNGGVAGPELTEIGLRRSPGYLREALLNPGASVSDGFLVVRVTTAQGQQIRGVRLNEDSFTLQLSDNQNTLHSFRKAELKGLKREFGVSTMPSYKDVLTAAELDDLVVYLFSLRGEK